MANVVKFDAAHCSACNACAVACIDQKGIVTGTGKVCSFRFVTESECKRPDGSYQFLQHMHGCMHCDPAPCMEACPRGCLRRDGETGLVLPDSTDCTACGACGRACPFQAIRFDAEGKMTKCDGCIDRVRAGLRPACEKICPPGVLTFSV